MLHLWFTKDLRSAFAIHAPVPELCSDGVLTPEACRSGVLERHEMFRDVAGRPSIALPMLDPCSTSASSVFGPARS